MQHIARDRQTILPSNTSNVYVVKTVGGAVPSRISLLLLNNSCTAYVSVTTNAPVNIFEKRKSIPPADSLRPPSTAKHKHAQGGPNTLERKESYTLAVFNVCDALSLELDFFPTNLFRSICHEVEFR